LMGAIVSFYFGARHQSKAQDFQRTILTGLALNQNAPIDAPPAAITPAPSDNPALQEWQARDGG